MFTQTNISEIVNDKSNTQSILSFVTAGWNDLVHYVVWFTTEFTPLTFSKGQYCSRFQLKARLISDINCLQQFLDKAKRWNITACNYSIDEFLNKCDIAMFKSSPKVDHCLNHIYISKQHHTDCMTLRQREHNFELPKLKYQTARSSFINRSLFNYV